MVIVVAQMDWVELGSAPEVAHYFLVVSLPPDKAGHVDPVVKLADHDRLDSA